MFAFVSYIYSITITHKQMNSNTKTETCTEFCKGCEDYTDKLDDYWGPYLCSECVDIYDNKTGYCDLECCLGQGCSGVC